jgi:hypothetical protein
MAKIRVAPGFFYVSGVHFVNVSWLPIGQQGLIVFSTTRTCFHLLEEFANCTLPAEKTKQCSATQLYCGICNKPINIDAGLLYSTFDK